MKLDVKKHLTLRLGLLFLYTYFNLFFLIEETSLLVKFQEVLQHLVFAAFLQKEGLFQQPVSW